MRVLITNLDSAKLSIQSLAENPVVVEGLTNVIREVYNQVFAASQAGHKYSVIATALRDNYIVIDPLVLEREITRETARRQKENGAHTDGAAQPPIESPPTASPAQAASGVVAAAKATAGDAKPTTAPASAKSPAFRRVDPTDPAAMSKV